MEKDLTVGSPRKVLWKFCLPLFGSIVFQQLYNIADSLVAGKFIGENALAAVGNSYEITLVFIAFAFGCNIGCSVVAARFFGAKRIADVKSAVSTAYISSAVLCLLLTVLGLSCAPLLLKAINTPDSIFADSLLYLYIYVGGLFFLFFYNIATGVFAALGDSVTPFILLAVSSVANIFVDILFVTVFSMGVAGVAWATFICQGISCVVANAVLVFRLKKLRSDEKHRVFSKEMLGEFARVAIPSMLQQGFVSVGNIVIQSIINTFGEAVIAGYSAAIKYNNFAVLSFTTLGNGMSNFTAQNIGAEKPDRVRKGFRAGLAMVCSFAVVFTLVYTLAGRYAVQLFMNDSASAEALSTGVTFLLIAAPFYVIIAAKIMADGVLRGAGEMKLFVISTFTDLILRVALSYLLSYFLGATGIWSAWPIGWGVATVLSLTFYFLTKKKLLARRTLSAELSDGSQVQVDGFMQPDDLQSTTDSAQQSDGSQSMTGEAISPFDDASVQPADDGADNGVCESADIPENGGEDGCADNGDDGRSENR